MASPKSFVSWIAAAALGIFILFVVLPVFAIFTFSGLASFMSPEISASDKLVSVVELEGMITDSREIVEELYTQAANKHVKGIVLRVNSPGGAVGPSQEIYSAIKKIREQKPVVASMGAVAASGGLYASLAADRIFCQPGTLTGSIGVVLQLPNVHKITDKFGFEMVTITSGELKDAGNAFRATTKKELDYFQDTVNQAYAEFVEAVASSRGLERNDVKAFADGRVLLGSQALQYGVVDSFGDVYDAARAALELSGSPIAASEMPDLMYPSDKMKFFKKILESVTNISYFLQGNARIQYL
ncbi:MAG: signal peptide peptidase SppA [Deltaproteobacteria bacterium]|nr:signal peptide peptidase SppA [Deltaproteobacteria bacterium]